MKFPFDSSWSGDLNTVVDQLYLFKKTFMVVLILYTILYILNLLYFQLFIALKAQSLFTTLKKKYQRKKKELKDSDRSGTSSASVLKAKNAFQN